MNNKFFFLIILTLFNLQLVFPCTMYKVTQNGKTIVGNNEDFLSPNNQFWFEPATTDNGQQYGVMYMGLLDNFAQGAINEAGLVFDGFAEPNLPVLNTEGKTKIWIGKAIRNIMQTMSSVEEVKAYLETINLSSLSSSMVVFVDQSGSYLIVEGDELMIGEESEKSFSNFYYSQIETLDDVSIPTFKNGQAFLKKTTAKPTLSYCSDVMKNYSKGSSDLFSTQYTTIYDLSALTVRLHLYQDYSSYVEIDLKEELKKGKHRTMMADLFSNEAAGIQFYKKYNDSENPTAFLQELINPEKYSEKELLSMEFDETINILGYEWLNDKKNPEAAIRVFHYGLSQMPNNADLYDSLGEAYLENNDWDNSIINYGKSLSLDPENNHAIEKLLEAKNTREEFKTKSFKELTDLIDLYATETLEKNNVNSISLAIYRDGQYYQSYYGEIDPGQNNAPNDNTLFEVASITKVFAGTLAAKAVLEEKITLDDDIRKYLGDGYENLVFEGTPVTIKNLLTHTLGFENPKKLKKIFKKTNEGYYENRDFDYTMDDFLQELKTVKLHKKPGTFYNYNNMGPELVAYILEKVYERPYENLLQDFLDELGMENTYLQNYEKHSQHLANGYDEEGNVAPLDKNPMIGGAYGMITTLPDLSKLMKFQLESNSPIVKEATTPLFEDRFEDMMGYLWQDMGFAEEEGFYYSKTGDSNGVKSGLLICPDSNYGQILLINNQSEAALTDWFKLFARIETDLIKYPQINLYSATRVEFIKNPTIGLEKFNRLKKNEDFYFNTDLIWNLNNLGYELIAENRINKAIEIFQFAIQQEPQNANLYDSLGEAYFMAKEYENSLVNYKKSLELNPENDTAGEYIEKLTKLLRK